MCFIYNNRVGIGTSYFELMFHFSTPVYKLSSAVEQIQIENITFILKRINDELSIFFLIGGFLAQLQTSATALCFIIQQSIYSKRFVHIFTDFTMGLNDYYATNHTVLRRLQLIRSLLRV